MSFLLLLNRLASAELDCAEFNARRTSPSEGELIRRELTAHLDCLLDGSRPGNGYYNRAVARRAGRLPPEALDELPAAVKAVELRPNELQPDTVGRLLALGFRPGGTLCYLAALPSAQSQLAPHPVAHPISRLDATQTDLFFDLLESAGTPFPAARRAVKQGFYCTAQFQAFVARDEQGGVMGWSTMFLHGACAFLGNSYTRPEMRGRGAHAALLAARLKAATEAGIEQIYTDVEHASQSHANCERAGFRTVTINTLWER